MHLAVSLTRSPDLALPFPRGVQAQRHAADFKGGAPDGATQLGGAVEGVEDLGEGEVGVIHGHGVHRACSGMEDCATAIPTVGVAGFRGSCMLATPDGRCFRPWGRKGVGRFETEYASGGRISPFRGCFISRPPDVASASRSIRIRSFDAPSCHLAATHVLREMEFVFGKTDCARQWLSDYSGVRPFHSSCVNVSAVLRATLLLCPARHERCIPVGVE